MAGGTNVCADASVEASAVRIARAVWNQYTDPSGVLRNVGGDMTNVRWVPGLSPALHRLLKDIEHACRPNPDTQEARRVVRFQTQALRIRYGTPMLVTLSPDEIHN